jgi:hypothetical protein
MMAGTCGGSRTVAEFGMPASTRFTPLRRCSSSSTLRLSTKDGSGSTLGVEAKRHLDAGELVPVRDLVKERRHSSRPMRVAMCPTALLTRFRKPRQ